MKVMITGGAGYIGSTVASTLEDYGYTPIILDSLVTGKREFVHNRIFYEGDISNDNLLRKIYHDHQDISCTIHCAALIIVPESVAEPIKYYRENVCKSLKLFETLIKLGQHRLIFSSSAAIYANSPSFQVNEDSPLEANCPYARTKIIIENMIEDFCRAYDFKCISLRYFNPIGAEQKFRSGSHDKNPTHLLGSLVEVVTGRRKVFQLNGATWPTRDGSAIRDYVHVYDLSRAHVLALQKFDTIFEMAAYREKKYCVINLGTEKGITVKEFVAAFERQYGSKLSKVETEPRPGDVVGAYANAEKARQLLNWRVEKSIEQGIADALEWDKKRQELLGY